MWDQGTAPIDRCKPTRKRDTYTSIYTHTQKHTHAEHMPQLKQEMRQDSSSCRWPSWKEVCWNNNSLVMITQELCESLSTHWTCSTLNYVSFWGFLSKRVFSKKMPGSKLNLNAQVFLPLSSKHYLSRERVSSYFDNVWHLLTPSSLFFNKSFHSALPLLCLDPKVMKGHIVYTFQILVPHLFSTFLSYP